MSTVDDLGIAHADSTDGTVALFNRRAPRISQLDVFRTADELLVQGHRPTIDRVRMKLGRGSPNTINDHLDAWWAKLGSRLRDLPGQEFPQLPERVGKVLQLLWTEAVNGAHEVLQSSLAVREQQLQEREQQVSNQAATLTEEQRLIAARAAALEDSLALAREHLVAATQRAERLEVSLQERDTEGVRLRTRLEEQERTIADLRAKLDVTETAHQAERARLEERHAVAEARWLTEVDRARQAVKETTREHERQVKVLRSQVDALQAEREKLRLQLADTRSELKVANAVRTHLEERVHRLQDLSQQRKSAPTSHNPAARRAKTTRPR